MVPGLESTVKNFFSLPNELFFLNIGHGALSTPICSTAKIAAPISVIPVYHTISDAVHLTVSTVMKHITKLADRQFITVENTSYIDKQGMKQYTILSIQSTMYYYYQQQMLRLEKQALMHQ